MPFLSLDPSTAQPAPVTAIGAPLVSQGETLLSLRTELKKQIIREIDAPRLDLWINYAYLHVASMLTLTEMYASLSLSTVLAQPRYMLPSVVAWVKSVQLDDPALYSAVGGRRLTMTDITGYRELPDFSSTWTYAPLKWLRFNRMLVLWPTPASAAAVTVDFRIRPQRLVADTHSPILPEEMHEAILVRARYVAFRGLKMFNEAAIAQNDFVSCIREISNSDAEELAGKPAAFFPATGLRTAYRRGSFRRMRDNDL